MKKIIEAFKNNPIEFILTLAFYNFMIYLVILLIISFII